MSALKSMVFYGLAVAIVKGASLVMLPITTSYLPADQYGVLNLMGSFISIASLVMALGLGEAVYRFSSRADTEATSIFSWCFTLSLLAGLLVVGGLFALKNTLLPLFPVQVLSHQFSYVLVTLYFSAITTVPYAIWRYQGQAKQYFTFVAGVCVTQSLLTLVLLAFGLGVDAMLCAGAVSHVVWGGIVLCRFHGLFSLYTLAKPLVSWKYLVSLTLACCTGYLLQGSEQWVIASAIGAASLAKYFIAVQLGLAVSFLVEPYKLWWFARRHKSIEQPQINNPLFSVLGVELTGASALFLMVFLPFAMPALLSEGYHSSLDWVGLLCVIAVIKNQSDLLNLGCYSKGSSTTPFVINLVAGLIMITLAMQLVNGYGLFGVIVANAIGNLVRALLFLFVSQRLHYQAYPYVRLASMWLFLLLGLYCYQHSHWTALSIFALCHISSCLYYYKPLYLPPAIKALRLAYQRIPRGLNG